MRCAWRRPRACLSGQIVSAAWYHRARLGMSFQFEKRPYGPGCAPEVITAIRGRVRVIGEGIVEVHDIPVGTAYTFGIMTDEMRRLTEGWSTVRVLVDISGTRPPNAEYREALYSFTEGESRITATALYIGQSRILLALTKFALAMFRRHMRAEVFGDRDAAIRYLEHGK